MFWYDLLLLVDFRRYYVGVYSWRRCSSTGWDVATRVSTCPARAPVLLFVHECVRLIWLLSRSVIESTIATMLGGHSTTFMFGAICSALIAIHWLLLIVVTILTCKIWSHVRNSPYPLSWILNIAWTLNGVTSFTLWASSQYRIACGVPDTSRHHLVWISRWISYGIVTWRSLCRNLVSDHSVLRSCLLISLDCINIVRWLWISQTVVCSLIYLRYSTVDVFIGYSRLTWWTNISWLLSSSTEWVPIRLVLISRWSYWRDTIALGNIFTVSWVSWICDSIQLWLLDNVWGHLLLLAKILRMIRCRPLVVTW